MEAVEDTSDKYQGSVVKELEIAIGVENCQDEQDREIAL